MCMCVFAHEFKDRGQKRISSPRAGVTGVCEVLDVGTKSCPGKAASVLSYRAVFPCSQHLGF